MSNSKKINIGIIGIGVMGTKHLLNILNNKSYKLTAICDIDKQKIDRWVQDIGVSTYLCHEDLLNSGMVEAVLIATPHYSHPQIAIDAFAKGINVLVEKPVAVHMKDAERMRDYYNTYKKKYPDLVFAVMFQQRTYGFWVKIRSLINDGEIGDLVRTTWIITDWFRTQSYYDGGGWRATWIGEGGGVLINQCPHNLDIYQWLLGMPNSVIGFVSLGKYHNIEVEDEVTVYLFHENGMIGHFITSTAEFPGTNRIEIVGDKGKIVFEFDKVLNESKLYLYKNDTSMLTEIKSSSSKYGSMTCSKMEISFDFHGAEAYKLMIDNFANSILYGEKLIAPGVEGLNSLMLSNAVLFSSQKRRQIFLPIDSEEYFLVLRELISKSKL
jgi:predicted dehydrogenase